MKRAINMKIIGIVVAVFLIIILVRLFIPSVLYCDVSGCPNETCSKSDYCYNHKCMNYNCDNARIGNQMYCEDCIERAMK